MIDNPAEVEATSQVSWTLPSCPGGVLPKPPRPAASSARHGSRGAWKPSLVRHQWLHLDMGVSIRVKSPTMIVIMIKHQPKNNTFRCDDETHPGTVECMDARWRMPDRMHTNASSQGGNTSADGTVYLLRTEWHAHFSLFPHWGSTVTFEKDPNRWMVNDILQINGWELGVAPF